MYKRSIYDKSSSILEVHAKSVVNFHEKQNVQRKCKTRCIDDTDDIY